MALCKDPRLTFLNDKGYNVILLPREGIDPLDIIGQDGSGKERLGSLPQIWTSIQAPPAVKPAVPAVGISGTRTDSLKLSIGLSLLSNALRGMGVQLPSIDAAYQHARQVQFSFTNVVSVAVDAFAVGNFLSAGDLANRNPFVTHYFMDEGTSAYVITEVLKSDSITVSAKSDSGASVAVDIPAIQQVVGAKVSVTTGAGAATDVTYKGQAMLTFGFKAFGIRHEGGQWSIFGVKAGAEHAFAIDMDAPAPALEPILITPGRMTVIGERSLAATGR